MEFKEIINAIRQYPWQVTVAVISLIPLYIIDLKFLAKRKVGLSRKIEIAKERGHVTKGMIIKKDAKRITVNRSNSDHNYWAARYTYTVAGKEYCRKFSCSPLSSTRSHLRTIINVYWIDDPARPFWDYSEDPLGDLYNILPHCSHGSSLFSLFSSCLVVLMRSDSIKYQLFPDSIHKFSGLCGQSPDFAEISGFYKIPFHHPASTAAEDLVTGKILR